MSKIDSVFIADLHLSPEDAIITERFCAFCAWACKHTRNVYILGDFFHVWPGDDALDEWSKMIAKELANLKAFGIPVYFMHGNRDFLLGKRFASLAHMKILKDPTVIEIDNQSVLLSHGDRYCTRDKGHQWLRLMTRNRLFTSMFLQLPYFVRNRIVGRVREFSKRNKGKTAMELAAVPSELINHMKRFNTKMIIHGHTHKHGITDHSHDNTIYKQFVVSDWDDNPVFVCYNLTMGLYLHKF